MERLETLVLIQIGIFVALIAWRETVLYRERRRFRMLRRDVAKTLRWIMNRIPSAPVSNGPAMHHAPKTEQIQFEVPDTDWERRLESDPEALEHLPVVQVTDEFLRALEEVDPHGLGELSRNQLEEIAEKTYEYERRARDAEIPD